MSDELHKGVLGLVLLAMLIDTVLPHPQLQANKHEYRFAGMIPLHRVQGFANERQWLFAHRKFRNRCVLEALAVENKKSEENLKFAFVPLNAGITLTDLREPNNDQYRRERPIETAQP